MDCCSPMQETCINCNSTRHILLQFNPMIMFFLISTGHASTSEEVRMYIANTHHGCKKVSNLEEHVHTVTHYKTKI